MLPTLPYASRKPFRSGPALLGTGFRKVFMPDLGLVSLFLLRETEQTEKQGQRQTAREREREMEQMEQQHACPRGRGKRSNDAAALIDTTGNEAGINKTLRVFFDEREREIQWMPCVES